MNDSFWNEDHHPPVRRPPARGFSARRRVAPTTLLVLLVLLAAPGFATSAAAAVFRVDATAGSDGTGCGTEATPCATIQEAVDRAVSGDLVLVAEGVYVDDVDCVGEAAVVCVFQKQVTLLGGFAGGDWSLPDPATNLTIIDGQNIRRGVLVKRGGSSGGLPATALHMEGFTVRNGRAVGAPQGFGGGMKANFSDVTLRDVVFRDNVALGGSGGLGGGGGAALLSDVDNSMDVVLERVVFLDNEVTGGGGTGGAGLGGGLVVDHATVTGVGLTFTGNSSTGGASSTDGRDGLGGGAAFSFGSRVTLQDVTASGNSTTGGSASSKGGSAFGGALFVEGSDSDPALESEIHLLDSTLTGNTARGGDGTTAGGGVGGGIMTFGATATVERTVATGNRGEGGVGSTVRGNGGGGGIFFEWPFLTTPPLNVVRNSIVADNVVEASQGGGAGIRLLAARAQVIHTTVVDNRIVGAGFGLGILVGPRLTQPSELTLRYSLLASHTVPSGGRTVHVQTTPSSSGSSADLTGPNLFAGNTNDTNEGEPNSGSFTGFPGSNVLDSATATFFVDPSTSDYHLNGTQPPVDSATGSSEALDVDGATRSGTRDLGADEFGALAFALRVGKVGVGTGTVTSSPAGIGCGADCFQRYDEDTVVDLTPTADPGFSFTGWLGDADCGDGSVTLTADRECTARFQDTVPASIVVEKQTVPDGRDETFTFGGAVAGSIGDGGQLVLDDVVPGTYVVTEEDHPLFDLTGVTCDDGDSTGDVGSASATFRVDAGETVTCVFTNTLTSCSAASDDLVLGNETVDDTRTETACNSITAGAYTVGAAGDVTFESLRVVLQDGFRVDGRFRIVIDTP